MVMASFGASMALRSLLEFIFTSQPAYFSRDIQMAIPLGAGVRVTPDQLLTLALAAGPRRRDVPGHDPHHDRPLDARGRGEPDARRASSASTSTR